MWDSSIYNKFSGERMQPSIDLMNRIVHREFDRILDVGCGSGLSTFPLRHRWTNADITGIDLSEDMLAKARETVETVTWIRRDCSKPLNDLGKFDLVFSNALLQWLNNQEEFLRNVSDILNSDGVLAVQLPAFLNMPVEICIKKTAAAYGNVFDGIEKELYKNYDACRYYDILKRYYSKVVVWQTNYFHVMDSHEAILDFVKGTALIPFLERLKEKEVEEFLQRVLEEIKNCYGVQEDGKVLFQFDRIFFVAEKNTVER